MDRLDFIGCLLSQIVLNPPRDPAATFSVDVDLVSVYCTVRDKSGAYVRNLAASDFELRDNGHPVEVRAFSKEVSAPLVLALLIDVSGSVSSIIEVEKAAAGSFLKAVMRPKDRALVAAFGDQVAIWQDFTSATATLLDALTRLDTAPFPSRTSRGGTLLYDAITLAAEQRLPSQSGRKTVILITDGVDQGSIANLSRACRAAQRSDAVVYAIHYADESGRSGKGDHGVGPLKKLTEPTGGRVFEMEKKLDLPSIFDSIQEEMRSQYSIGFRPSAGPPEFHKLDLRVRQSGLRVYAREGYYARSLK